MQTKHHHQRCSPYQMYYSSAIYLIGRSYRYLVLISLKRSLCWTPPLAQFRFNNAQNVSFSKCKQAYKYLPIVPFHPFFVYIYIYITKQTRIITCTHITKALKRIQFLSCVPNLKKNNNSNSNQKNALNWRRKRKTKKKKHSVVCIECIECNFWIWN